MNKGKILVELQEHMGSDISIANAAWTSTYDKHKREDKYDDPEKVADLVRNKIVMPGHGVPLESVIFRFWIRMPIMTDRQHVTHRVASHNGLSGRYRTMPDDWFPMPIDVQDIFTKIGHYPWSGGCVAVQYDHLCADANDWYRRQVSSLKNAEQKDVITNEEFKRAREIIRGVLPTAGMVERTTIMNLRSFANYQRQRGRHAQVEIRTVARLMLEEVEKANIAPVAIQALKDVRWLIDAGD